MSPKRKRKKAPRGRQNRLIDFCRPQGAHFFVQRRIRGVAFPPLGIASLLRGDPGHSTPSLSFLRLCEALGAERSRGIGCSQIIANYLKFSGPCNLPTPISKGFEGQILKITAPPPPGSGVRHPATNLRHSGAERLRREETESRPGGNSQSPFQAQTGSIQTSSVSTPSQGITRKGWIPGATASSRNDGEADP